MDRAGGNNERLWCCHKREFIKREGAILGKIKISRDAAYLSGAGAGASADERATLAGSTFAIIKTY